MKYLSWEEKNILGPDGNMPSEKYIAEMYAHGFVFTRIARGIMQQTRAIRIDLSKFELSSENRRILKKMNPLAVANGSENSLSENSDASLGGTGNGASAGADTGADFNRPNFPKLDFLKEKEIRLPLATTDYHWSTAKLAKDFYATKFGDGIMSAAKIKEMLTDGTKSNFNSLLSFFSDTSKNIGFAICYKNSTMLHYSYPFYDLSPEAALPKDMGLGMMITAVEHAKKAGLKYIYLGSLQRPGDTYKLQFKGIEWFDGGPDGSGDWSSDIEKAKKILSSQSE